MASHTFQLSNRSRRLLWRNQHKEYQESIAGQTKPPHSTRLRDTSSTWIRLWDPVTSLPLELAVMCLRFALPSGKDYPAALIELTSVSTRWQDLLFSVPHLWTKIHVRYSAHDLMAILSLFLHLSAEAPLDLTVWNTPGSAWEGIKSLLAPHIHRIRGLALGDDPPIYYDSPYAGAAYMSLASDIFNSLGQLPGLVELDFGRILHIHPSQLKTLGLPSGISVSNGVDVHLENMLVLYPSLSLFLGKGMHENVPYGAGMLIVEPNDTRVARWPFVDSHYDSTNYTVSSLNSSILFLADALKSLGYPETCTNLSASSPQMAFINTSTNRCYLCDMIHRSLSRALGCVRSHFGFSPFQCSGCRTCNAKNGYASFCIFNLLLNHIGPKACVECGTQRSEHWEQDDGGNPICSTCDPMAVRIPLQFGPPQPKKIYHSQGTGQLIGYQYAATMERVPTMPVEAVVQPMPPVSSTLLTVHGLPMLLCTQCGHPRMYEDGKCVEKWGPGPEGPRTVYNRCREKMKPGERTPVFNYVLMNAVMMKRHQYLIAPASWSGSLLQF